MDLQNRWQVVLQKGCNQSLSTAYRPHKQCYVIVTSVILTSSTHLQIRYWFQKCSSLRHQQHWLDSLLSISSYWPALECWHVGTTCIVGLLLPSTPSSATHIRTLDMLSYSMCRQLVSSFHPFGAGLRDQKMLKSPLYAWPVSALHLNHSCCRSRNSAYSPMFWCALHGVVILLRNVWHYGGIKLTIDEQRSSPVLCTVLFKSLIMMR